MNKQTVRARIEDIGIIPSVRTSSSDDARFAAETISKAGIPIVEITMTVPGALDVIAGLVEVFPDMVVGAGTVLDVETARRCVDIGARFLTSPGLDLKVVQLATEKGVCVMPGALTPTEVTTAWNAGVRLVKVFPCAPFGGESYIRALRGPFPEMSFVAAGGVNQQTAANFIRAGAVAIGVGKELIPTKALELRQTDWITELARRFVNLVRGARGLHEEG
jgi:2-dehydro-3-deoxyphosphogluconate aldolase/(4S)-4-hydroxy-2-oxoglutarate aldolase